ncbi:TonB-dependent outer membrane siderophore receptor [Neokomagataea thailandica NBRC 106555]|nr:MULTISPECIES: TonB-dependent receptor [Neokomagataea]GBR54748.1 TonB-dependent outer membrane siderophore receptor [Neokomagataea thailandica NBRC 106555]
MTHRLIFTTAALALASAAHAGPKHKKAEQKSEEITVTAHHLSTTERNRRQLASIPGGTSVIDSKQVLKGRNMTNADALALQPGVFAQSSGGGDGLRLSIRGSGIQTGTNYFRSGLLMMFDGLPVTIPAGTPYELFEPLGIADIEVLRGANAFDYGGLQLGGGINYNSTTGAQAQKYQARVEGGSFGYLKEQVSSGQVVGKADYYISLTNSYRGGYQQQTRATSFGVEANFGYRFNDHVETRLFFRYRQTQNGYPGFLTRNQILNDPTQAQSPYRAIASKRIQPGSKFYADMTTLHFDDDSVLRLGVDVQDAPIDIEQQAIATIWLYQTVGAIADYQRHDHILGRVSDTDIGYLGAHNLTGWEKTQIRVSGVTGAQLASKGAGGFANASIFNAYANLPIGTVLSRYNYGGADDIIHFRNNTQIVKDFWLTLAAAIDREARAASVAYPTQSGLSTDSVNFVPRAGLRWVASPHVTLYGNISRSLQPPNDWNYMTGHYYSASALQAGLSSGATRLRNQTATTFEVGSEGNFWRNQWSISYYHSNVRNELLTVQTAASQASGTQIYGNATPTTHQGVEASLSTTLLSWGGNSLSLRQAYTWQDFRFRNDPQFGRNRLPGIPEHFYQGELHLDLKAGFYAGLIAQVSSRVSGSYDDTYFAPAYHIYNLNLGYDWPGKHRQVFLSINNIGNTHYAAIVVPGYRASGQQLAVFQPGDGLGVFAGASIGFN